MDRRKFISQSGAGAAAAVAALTVGDLTAAAAESAAVQTQGRKRALMKAGATANAYDALSLQTVLRYGVKNIVATPQIAEEGRLYATVDELKKMRELPD